MIRTQVTECGVHYRARRDRHRLAKVLAQRIKKKFFLMHKRRGGRIYGERKFRK